MLIKPLKTIIFTIILGMVYIMPTVARAACAENEIDVLGDGTQCETAKFTVTTTEIAGGGEFKFLMTAIGTFYVDCGDGGTLSGTGASGKTIVRTTNTEATYTCTYNDAGVKTIRFGGVASRYHSGAVAAIRFNGGTPTLVAGISGSLGAIFPTMGVGAVLQPSFRNTFNGCAKLTGSIPENLFSGISGAPVSTMFQQTFTGCSNLTGSIPAGLFSGISGAPADGMFASTFSGCAGLTGTIPAGLFAGISGPPTKNMFYRTFMGCSKLTGSIPENLFAGISGAPVTYMFSGTFSGCAGLTGTIPAGLFAGISGSPATYMFYATFHNCSKLTGSIPENLFAGISGAPVAGMFRSTFSGCMGLTGTIPAGLFSGISGAPAVDMFRETFYYCSGLTGFVPPALFQGITNSGTVTNHMTDVFARATGLATKCPSCHKQYITGFEQYWSNRVSCEFSVGENEHIYNDVCYQDCGAGITKIKTSTGLVFPIFSTKPTTPAINVKYNDVVCYIPLEAGDGGAGSMNILYNNETYHLGVVTAP